MQPVLCVNTNTCLCQTRYAPSGCPEVISAVDVVSPDIQNVTNESDRILDPADRENVVNSRLHQVWSLAQELLHLNREDRDLLLLSTLLTGHSFRYTADSSGLVYLSGIPQQSWQTVSNSQRIKSQPTPLQHPRIPEISGAEHAETGRHFDVLA